MIRIFILQEFTFGGDASSEVDQKSSFHSSRFKM